jgi:predicted SAM-dependent methyltransferase
MDMIRCLNLGCGQRFHPDWENLDLHSADPSVQKWDLQNDLPFPDKFFDVVYHSHVLEHLSKMDGLQLLLRCHRVLKPNGTLRVVVPDLERIVRHYLEALEKSVAGDSKWTYRYEWALLEMYDQTVRESPGGEMREAARAVPEDQVEFLRQRFGSEVDQLMQTSDSFKAPRHQNQTSTMMRFTEGLRRKALRLIMGQEGIRLYDLGKFRVSGEVHRWMYDAYSLSTTLEQAGFHGPRRVGAAESAIPGWADFHLDTEPDGRIYKPDSLFMEATAA